MPLQSPDLNNQIQAIRRRWFSGLVFGLLNPQGWRSAALSTDAMRAHALFHAQDNALLDLRNIILEPGRIWTTLEFEFTSGRIRIRGLPKDLADEFERLVIKTQIKCWMRLTAPLHVELGIVARHICEYLNPSRYINAKLADKLIARTKALLPRLPKSLPIKAESLPAVMAVDTLHHFLKHHAAMRVQANKIFVANELKRGEEFFDSVEQKPLTAEQRQTVVIDEDCNLAMAAAGSGKTGVVIAKVGWLLARGFQNPEDILLVAFAKKARDDMQRRIAQRLGDDIAEQLEVSTFHSLGLQIIGDAEGKKPSLSIMAEDNSAIALFIKNAITVRFTDTEFGTLIFKWFQSFFAPFKGIATFATKAEYAAYVKSHEMRTIKGDLVKSFEECEIANFLYLNGVRYEYEKPYKIDTATKKRRQYKPDFYLTDYDIYLEHFAITETGQPPDFINAEAYLSSMEWKRQLHAEHETRLIETFSHEKSNDREKPFDKILAARLVENGVELNPIPGEQVFEQLETQQRLNPFVVLLTTFLNHFKGSQHDLEKLRAKASKKNDSPRLSAFLTIFGAVFESYEAELASKKEIDFHDMIAKATNYVENGRYESCFKYIIVDEFQDISKSRAALLKALVDARPETQLLCVGDDWQAIYRFAGADISIMRNFAENFGVTERTDLGTTFRCPDRLANLSREFILKNPAQIDKQIRSVRQANRPCVLIGRIKEDGKDLLSEAFHLIEKDAAQDDEEKTVMILGRYKHQKPCSSDPHIRGLAKLKVSFSTVHAAKGLEADYVIVLGMNSGKYGFPSEMTDDPILDLILAEPEQHANAEERRLFYVALTRAKRKVYLLLDPKPASTFIYEIENKAEYVERFGASASRHAKCPECKAGDLNLRKGPKGKFSGCSNFPVCEFTQPICPKCRDGNIAKAEERFRCDNCDETYQQCPKCNGWLRQINGIKGPFLGCSNWPDCNYTRDIMPKHSCSADSIAINRPLERS